MGLIYPFFYLPLHFLYLSFVTTSYVFSPRVKHVQPVHKQITFVLPLVTFDLNQIARDQKNCNTSKVTWWRHRVKWTSLTENKNLLSSRINWQANDSPNWSTLHNGTYCSQFTNLLPRDAVLWFTCLNGEITAFYWMICSLIVMS